MIPFSALIITKNEEKTIARCLKSLCFANEILVVDGGSTDRTIEICKDPSQPWAKIIRVESRPWTGFRDQRNYALSLAKNQWILVVDSDEACSPELRSRIEKILSEPNGPSHQAYKVRRLEYFLGKPIRFGIWNPSYQDRFFNKAGVQYVNEVHEYPKFPSPPQMIHECLEHSPDFTPEKFLQKMNSYTSIEARDRIRQGQRTHLGKLLGAFPAMFLKNYFYYQAYKDGFHGFVISLLEGVSRVVRHVKMWQLQNEEKR